MADYYGQATVQPSLPMTEQEMVFFKWVKTWESDYEIPVDTVPQGLELPMAELRKVLEEREDKNAPFDLSGLSCEKDEDDLWYFFSKENLPEGTVEWFQWYLRRHREIPHVMVEVAFTCSKMRPDGFGGAAFFITKNHVRSVHTNEWLEGIQQSVKYGPIEASNMIKAYMHCGKCLEEKPADQSPKEWARIQVGFTKRGIQVWCNRHEINVMHMDLEGIRHPANQNREPESH